MAKQTHLGFRIKGFTNFFRSAKAVTMAKQNHSGCRMEGFTHAEETKKGNERGKTERYKNRKKERKEIMKRKTYR